MTLTVAMITLNEEKNLERTLKSVQDFADEIVIVDSGSTDKTEEIAKKFGAKFVYQQWLGYGPQRNRAIELSTSDWILNIDADEEISPELANKIKGIRAALAHNEFTAKLSRLHNDANIIALGARVLGDSLAIACVETFINTEFEGGRHARRVGKIEK